MIITYLNDIGNPITKQQAENLEIYSMVYSINNNRKKRELYQDGKLVCIFYNKDEGETEENVHSLLMSYGILGISFVIREIQIIGNYRFEISNEYAPTGELEDITHSLYENISNDFVAEEYIDLNTNLPKYDETIKLYYDRSIDPDNQIFRGIYDDDGNLDYIKFNPYNTYPHLDCIWFGTDGIEGEEDIPTLCLYTGLSREFIEYYLNADILPPPRN